MARIYMQFFLPYLRRRGAGDNLTGLNQSINQSIESINQSIRSATEVVIENTGCWRNGESKIFMLVFNLNIEK